MAKTLLANPDITVDQVAARLGVSPATLYRSCLAAAGASHALGECREGQVPSSFAGRAVRRLAPA